MGKLVKVKEKSPVGGVVLPVSSHFQMRSFGIDAEPMHSLGQTAQKNSGKDWKIPDVAAGKEASPFRVPVPYPDMGMISVNQGKSPMIPATTQMHTLGQTARKNSEKDEKIPDTCKQESPGAVTPVPYPNMGMISVNQGKSQMIPVTTQMSRVTIELSSMMEELPLAHSPLTENSCEVRANKVRANLPLSSPFLAIEDEGNKEVENIPTNTLSQSPIPATSLTNLQTQGINDDALVSMAEMLGYSGNSKEQTILRNYIKEIMGGLTDKELDDLIEEQIKPQSLYQKINLTGGQTDRLKHLKIPSTLQHEHLKQNPQSGACQAVAAIAGQQLRDVGLLQSILERQTPTTAFFKFPSAKVLEPYTEHSSEETKKTIRRIIEIQNNVYAVQKEIHMGDLLPNTEPWANLLLKALHQHITQLGYGNLDSYEVHIPLQVRKTTTDVVKDITFNVLTAAVGEGKSGQDVAQFTDEELKGKKLQIGHKGHATTLVVRANGSKVYYDNQVGIQQIFTTVQKFLRSRGMTGPDTSIIIE